MSKPSQREQVQKGLQHLKGSDKIIGDIVGYCVQAYKADSSQKTIDKVKKYVEDTANSVSEHVLTIAHNLNKIIDAEAKEIEDLSFQTGYVSHRLKSHQRYMSELFMTKFQTFPRPRPTIHILRQAIPENQLPRYARRKRQWQRQTGFDYKILDQVGAKRVNASDEPASPRYGPSGVSSPYTPSASQQSQSQQSQQSQPSKSSQFVPKAVVKSFNPYEAAASPHQSGQNKTPVVKAGGATLFQQSQNSGFGFSSQFNAAPPSFGSVDANVGRGMSPSVVKYVGGGDDSKQAQSQAPAQPYSPAQPRPPSIPNNVGAPPQVPDIPPMAAPSHPPQPPPAPNFGASFNDPGMGGGGPPVPPVPNVGGPPPVPPVPNVGGPPPIPPVPNMGGPPPPP